MQSLNSILQLALTKAKGNKTHAKRFLIEEAAKDPHVAQQLAIPFLDSIAGYAIDHFMRTNTGAVQATQVMTEAARKEAAAKGSTQHKAAMEALIGAYKKKE